MLKPIDPICVDLELYEETAIALAQATIENATRSAGLSRAELAKAMGRPRSFITRIMRGDHNLTVRTLARAVAACGFQVTFAQDSIRWVWRSDEPQMAVEPQDAPMPLAVAADNTDYALAA